MKKILYKTIMYLGLTTLIFLTLGKINTMKLNIEEQRLFIDKLPKSFVGTKLVHFSDLHLKCDQSIDRLQKTVDNIVLIDPEIIIFSGDLISGDCNLDYTKIVAKTMEPLENIVWKFYLLGDEDTENTSKYVFNYLEFRELNNDTFKLYNSDLDSISLIGITSETDIDTSLLSKDTSSILITHQPNHLSSVDLSNIDIAFTSHTLLGKIYVPFYKGLFNVEGASTIGYQDYEIVSGLEIYTSRGVGTDFPHIRYFNDPTIHFYRLDKK